LIRQRRVVVRIMDVFQLGLGRLCHAYSIY
jgi:hypothetical protein